MVSASRSRPALQPLCCYPSQKVLANSGVCGDEIDRSSFTSCKEGSLQLLPSQASRCSSSHDRITVTATCSICHCPSAALTYTTDHLAT
eukprot:2288265-Rhodomonas_salina.2